MNVESAACSIHDVCASQRLRYPASLATSQLVVHSLCEGGLNYLCEGYRTFLNHIHPAMKYMVEALRHRAPPAGIMQVLADGVDAGLMETYGVGTETA